MELVKKKRILIIISLIVIFAACAIFGITAYIKHINDPNPLSEKNIEQAYLDLMTKYGAVNPELRIDFQGTILDYDVENTIPDEIDIDRAFNTRIYTPVKFTLVNNGDDNISDDDVMKLLIEAYRLTDEYMRDYNKEFDENDSDRTLSYNGVYTNTNLVYIEYICTTWDDEQGDEYFLKTKSDPKSDRETLVTAVRYGNDYDGWVLVTDSWKIHSLDWNINLDLPNEYYEHDEPIYNGEKQVWNVD